MAVAGGFAVLAVRRSLHHTGGTVAHRRPGTGQKITIRFVKKPGRAARAHHADAGWRTLSTRDLGGQGYARELLGHMVPACREEILTSSGCRRNTRTNLQIIGISIDEGSTDAVRTFALEHKINYARDGTPELRQAFPGVFPCRRRSSPIREGGPCRSMSGS